LHPASTAYCTVHGRDLQPKNVERWESEPHHTITTPHRRST
jgi:hypothetical protein